MNRPGSPPIAAPGRNRRGWFVWFAPLTVPAYLLYLAVVTLSAGAYYLTVESTWSRLTGRPGSVGRWGFVLITPLAVALMPPVVFLHVVIWLARQAYHAFAALGAWQTNLPRGAAAALVGLAWSAAAAWCTVTCIDIQGGLWLIGAEVPGAREFGRAMDKRLTLGELSAAAQARRRTLAETFVSGVNCHEEEAGLVVEILRDDTVVFASLDHRLRERILGLPWYLEPARYAKDGVDHCEFLGGPLGAAVLLLVRWPGLHGRRSRAMPLALFFLRTGIVFGLVVYCLSWRPWSVTPPAPPGARAADYFTSPALWFGVTGHEYAPPQWLGLNVALWLVLMGGGGVIWAAARAMRPSLGAPGYYTAFMAVRLLQRKRIAFFSIGAVTLCVAMELIVISVMGGFLDTIRDRSHALLGDLLMEAGMTGFPFYEEFMAEIRAWPEVAMATPVIHSYGVLRIPDTGRTKTVEIRGIRLDEYRRVNGFGAEGVLFYDRYYPGTTRFEPAGQPTWGLESADGAARLPAEFESAWEAYLAGRTADERRELLDRWERVAGEFRGPGVFALSADGRPGWAGKPLPGIILGRDVILYRQASGEYARDARYPRGLVCQVSMLPLTRRGQVSDQPPLAPAFRYVDDSRTGVYEIDNRTVYVAFDELQRLLSMTPQQRADGAGTAPARCTQVQIKLAAGVDIKELKRRVQEAWDAFSFRQEADADDRAAMQNVQVSDWEEVQRDFIDAIQKEKVLVVIMFGIISLVAVLLVLCIFYMIVVEKTRDIGILKSVGASAQGVAAVFLAYGAAIGVSGAALGSLLGWAFVHHINHVQNWLARLNPDWRIWSPETYSFDQIPDTVKVGEALWIAGLAVAASLLGAVIPAIRAARTWPVEALRYE